MKQAALLVGINRYDDDAIVDLAYAEQDAREFYAFLKRTALYDEVRHLPASEADEDRILNAAARLTDLLEPGDLFLFFFAGHGVQYRGRHLLLCPEVRFHRLEFGHHTVPVDLLKRETARPGVSRVFVLDACRGNLLATREGPAQGFRGAPGLRDIVCHPAPQEGPLSILCSCDEGRQAQELPRLEQGLFSRALLEEFEGAARAGAELKLDDRLEHALRERMSRLARDHDLPLLDQRPWIQRSGEAPALLHGRRREPSAPDLSPPARTPGLPPVLPGRWPPESQTEAGAAGHPVASGRDWRGRPGELEKPPEIPKAGGGRLAEPPEASPVQTAPKGFGVESGTSGRDRAAAGNGPQPSPAIGDTSAGDKPMAEPARLARLMVRSQRRWLEQEAVYSVLVDGVEAGRLSNGRVSSFSLAPGRHALELRYSCYPRAWRRVLRRRPLDVSAAPIDVDLDPGSERVVDCDVNELSWLLAVPGLHVIMILLLEFTPWRWLRLRPTATFLSMPAQPPAKVAPPLPLPPPSTRPAAGCPQPPARVLPPPPPDQAAPPPAHALKSHRGGTILALGILGFFTFGLAGISAWVEGNKDLKEMSAGTMDPGGWRLTEKGRNWGMAATIVWAVILLGLAKGHLFGPLRLHR